MLKVRFHFNANEWLRLQVTPSQQSESSGNLLLFKILQVCARPADSQLLHISYLFLASFETIEVGFFQYFAYQLFLSVTTDN